MSLQSLTTATFLAATLAGAPTAMADNVKAPQPKSISIEFSVALCNTHNNAVAVIHRSHQEGEVSVVKNAAEIENMRKIAANEVMKIQTIRKAMPTLYEKMPYLQTDKTFQARAVSLGQRQINLAATVIPALSEILTKISGQQGLCDMNAASDKVAEVVPSTDNSTSHLDPGKVTTTITMQQRPYN